MASLRGNTARLGVCFDIDGVLRRGSHVIPGASASLQRLSAVGIPYLFMTNGGGHLESYRAKQLGELLGQTIKPEQIVLSHSPMRQLVQSLPPPSEPASSLSAATVATGLAHKRMLVLGCREELTVAKEYGFRKVVSPQALVAQHPELYPFRKIDPTVGAGDAFCDEIVQGILVMHDPIDWHLEVQVCLDVLLGTHPYSSDGLDTLHGNEYYHPGRLKQAVPIFNSNEDFQFAAAYVHPRLAQGSFLLTLEKLYQQCSGGESLRVARYGKPHGVTYDYARGLLAALDDNGDENFDKIFMIGDNVLADIKGANDAGDPWHSVLVETGMYRPGDDTGGAKTVLPDVGAAVDFILEQK